ncbi:hypothetical protein DBV05_g7153 [Lasiodiplodia theobromae]|uniref:DUF2293 domain-containing protein n=1 Tax=Lasiodiplodia theobromae TaxID=45133 RepID=A0A5N5D8X8_9PEZI|nr:hypothetical protein DBV05_g7153 [Lasiodiplodia theobromae]
MAPRPGQEREVNQRVPVRPDYVFVKKGDQYITRHCRQLTKEMGKDLFVVVDDKRRSLGLRVPKHIHSTVLAADAATKADRLAATAARDSRLLANARSTLLRLYPATPADAVDDIVAHTFRKHSGRVGRAGDMELDEKVTLGLRAHVRHKYTDYDRLMRHEGLDKDEARRRIAHEVDEVVRKWQGGEQGPIWGRRRLSLRNAGVGVNNAGSGGGSASGSPKRGRTKGTSSRATTKKTGGGIKKRPRMKQKRTLAKTPRVSKTARKPTRSTRARRGKKA